MKRLLFAGDENVVLFKLKVTNSDVIVYCAIITE